MWYNAGNERPHAQNFCKINELGIIFENCDLSVTLTGFQCMMSYFFFAIQGGNYSFLAWDSSPKWYERIVVIGCDSE